MMDRNFDLNYSHAFKIVILTSSLTFLFFLCMICVLYKCGVPTASVLGTLLLNNIASLNHKRAQFYMLL